MQTRAGTVYNSLPGRQRAQSEGDGQVDPTTLTTSPNITASQGVESDTVHNTTHTVMTHTLEELRRGMRDGELFGGVGDPGHSTPTGTSNGGSGSNRYLDMEGKLRPVRANSRYLESNEEYQEALKFDSERRELENQRNERLSRRLFSAGIESIPRQNARPGRTSLLNNTVTMSRQYGMDIGRRSRVFSPTETPTETGRRVHERSNVAGRNDTRYRNEGVGFSNTQQENRRERADVPRRDGIGGNEYTATGLQRGKAIELEWLMTDRPVLKDLRPKNVSIFLEGFYIHEEEVREHLGLEVANLNLCISREAKVELRSRGINVLERDMVMDELHRINESHSQARQAQVLKEVQEIKYQNIGNIPDSTREFCHRVDEIIRGTALQDYTNSEMCKWLILALPFEMTSGSVGLTQKERNWYSWWDMKADLMQIADRMAGNSYTSSLLSCFTDEKERPWISKGLTLGDVEKAQRNSYSGDNGLNELKQEILKEVKKDMFQGRRDFVSMQNPNGQTDRGRELQRIENTNPQQRTFSRGQSWSRRNRFPQWGNRPMRNAFQRNDNPRDERKEKQAVNQMSEGGNEETNPIEMEQDEEISDEMVGEVYDRMQENVRQKMRNADGDEDSLTEKPTEKVNLLRAWTSSGNYLKEGFNLESQSSDEDEEWGYLEMEEDPIGWRNLHKGKVGDNKKKKRIVFVGKCKPKFVLRKPDDENEPDELNDFEEDLEHGYGEITISEAISIEEERKIIGK